MNYSNFANAIKFLTFPKDNSDIYCFVKANWKSCHLIIG